MYVFVHYQSILHFKVLYFENILALQNLYFKESSVPPKACNIIYVLSTGKAYIPSYQRTEKHQKLSCLEF